MATVWEFAGDDLPTIDTQPSGRARVKTTVCAVIAIAAGTIFGCTDTPVITHDPGWASANIISVEKVRRSVPVPASRTARDLYRPDGKAGLSTRRLAEITARLFVPIEDDDVDVDYSFG